MAKSLADQLLGAGLVDRKKAQKVKNEKRKQDNHNRKHKIDVVDEVKLAAEQARKDKIERDRELNLQRKQEADQKALQAQAKQIIDHAKIKLMDADIKYNFVDQHDKKIKSIYVTPHVQACLAVGTLAIAGYENNYFVIPKIAAEKLMERLASSVLFLAEPEDTQVDEDDPYKDYVIPDDLMW